MSHPAPRPAGPRQPDRGGTDPRTADKQEARTMERLAADAAQALQGAPADG